MASLFNQPCRWWVGCCASAWMSIGALHAQDPKPVADGIFDTNGLQRGFQPWIDFFQDKVEIVENDFRVDADEGKIRLRGTVALPVPPAGQALRMRFEPENLAGVTYLLKTDEAVYEIKPNQETLRLVARQQLEDMNLRMADDDGLWIAMMDGLLDLHLADGEAVFARANQVFFRFPLLGTPTSLQLKADGILWDCRFVTLPVPASVPDPFLLPDKWPAADELEWVLQGDSNGVEVLREEGAIEVRTDSGEHHRAVKHLLPSNNAYAVSFRVDELSSGAGLAHMHPGGRVSQVQFREDEGGFVASHHARNTQLQQRGRRRGYVYPTPFYVRFVVSPISVKTELSRDGSHWQLFERGELGAEREQKESAVTILLAGEAKEKPQRIRVSHAAVKTLPLFASWQDPELEKRLPAFFGAEDNHPQRIIAKRRYGELLAARPQGVVAEDWQLACALLLLEVPSTGTVRLEVVQDAFDAALAKGLPADTILAGLQELLALVPAQRTEGNGRVPDYAKMAAKLGHRITTEKEWQHVPEWLEFWYRVRLNIRDVRFGAEKNGPPALVRAWFYELQSRKDWAGLERAAKQYKFFARPVSDNRLPFWMADQAAAGLAASVDPDNPDNPGNPDGAAPERPVDTHPVQLSSDRETMNLLADFHAAAEGGEIERACRLLLNAAPPRGVVADPSNLDLYQQARHLIRSAVEKHPDVRRELEGSFLPIGKIRLQQAIAEGRIEDLDPLAALFLGTPVARRAELLMADRALGAGHFLRAAKRYQEVLEIDPGPADEKPAAIEARRQLALSLAQPLAGRSDADAPDEDLRFPGGMVAAAELRELIGEPTTAPAARTLPERWPEQLVHEPAKIRPKFHAGFAVETVSLPDGATLICQDGLLVCLAGTNERWRVEFNRSSVPTKFAPRAGHSDDLAIVASPDINQRTVSAFGLADGKALWKTDLPHGCAGDPAVVGRSVFVPMVESGNLHLVQLDRVSGRIAATHRIARYQPPTQWPQWIRNTAVPGGRIFAGTGFVLRIDADGGLLWLRRMPLVPPLSDTDDSLFRTAPPIAAGGKVVCLLPGALRVSCLDIDSGALVWDVASPALEVLSATDTQVVVQHSYGLEALKLEDGVSVWQHAQSPLSQVFFQGDDVVEIDLSDQSPAMRRFNGLGKLEQRSAIEKKLNVQQVHAFFPWQNSAVLITADFEGERHHGDLHLWEIQP